MHLTNTFEVSRPPAQAWPVLTDIPGLVTCIPGATLHGRDGDTYTGDVLVKVGPVALRFEGAVEVDVLDEGAHTLAVRGRAREQRGQGTVEAAIRLTLSASEADPLCTTATVVTDLDLGGKVAQFGAGMIQKISGRIIDQFATRLESRMSAGAAGAAVPATARPAAGARPAPSDADIAVGDTAVGDTAVGALSLAIAAAGAFVFGWTLGRVATR